MDRQKPNVKLTHAQRVALWRQRQRENPQTHAEYKRKERERYQIKKEKGVIKPIKEMKSRELRRKRRGWRKYQTSTTGRRKKF